MSVESDKIGWVGIDLDGTLCQYDYWRGKEHIGSPIPLMFDKVKEWISEGKTIKIFTARAHDPEAIPFIRDWLRKYDLKNLDGSDLEITNVKDYGMIELYDDRAVQIIPNTGIRADGKTL